MILQEREKNAIEELKQQEEICVEKYKRYEKEAKDPVLQDLFHSLQSAEQKHYDTLGQILNGTVTSCDCNDSKGREYDPKATYISAAQDKEKMADSFLATDSIGTEKLVSSGYNEGVFEFADPAIRKQLASIQIEEQNHAEMLYKYKMVNGMS